VLLLWCALHSFRQFCGHARIHFDGYAFLRFLEYAGGQIACSRANFEDDV
jgi:hypothetical protein